MYNRLVGKLFYQFVKPLLVYKGNKEDVKALTELVQLVASAPAGRKILEGIMARRKPVTLFFVSELKNNEGLPISGQYYWVDNSVKLLRKNQDLSKMNREEAIRSKIETTCVLAHELQHSADGSINKWLDLHAANIDESVLVNVLAEAHAVLSEDQLDRELRAQYGLLGKRITQGKEEKETTEPVPTARLKKATERALSGEISMFRGYMNRRRRLVSRRKYPERGLRATAVFRETVEDYLKEMNVSMSFTEAIMHVKQSIKLLPAAKIQSEKRDR